MMKTNFRPNPNWLTCVVPRRQPFFPQIGDEVVYFRLGHEWFVEQTTDLFELNKVNYTTTYSRNMGEQEIGKIAEIEFEMYKKERLCCLKLELEDANGMFTGESFTLKYHDVNDVLDFLVLRQSYDLALRRLDTWKPNARFRCVIEDKWYEGKLVLHLPQYSNRPNSNFECCRIQLDNEQETRRLSAWELEPIDEKRRPTEGGNGVQVLPSEIVRTLYRSRPEDWRGHRDTECDRISAGLGQVMSLDIAKSLASAVDLNLCPYPIDLSTIRKRLDNRFYRRVSAVEFDVNYIVINACKLYNSQSNEICSASIIKDLCLEIIQNRDVVEIPTIYQRLVKKYKLRDEGSDSNGPSTSRAEAASTPNTSTSSRRNLQLSDSESEEDFKSSKSVDTPKSKGKEIVVTEEVSWKQQCKDLLKTLNHSEDSVPFREPIDTLYAPEYLEVIDHPMDLQTVLEELQSGNYGTPFEFAKDVRLIFENSKNYNPNELSKIYGMTVRLSILFEDLIRNILTFYEIQKTAAGCNFDIPRSNDTKSTKGKSLAPKNKGIKIEVNPNGVEASKESIEIVPSRTGKRQKVAIPPSSSFHSIDSGIGSPCRRILEDDEISQSSSNLSTIPNGDFVVSTEDIDVRSDTSGFSNSAKLPITNSLVKCGLKRKIFSDHDEDKGPQDVNKSQNDQTILRAPIKREVPPVVTLDTSEESSSEDEKMISQRRRIPVAMASVQVVKEKDVRPSSSSSSNKNRSNSGSLGQDGDTLRRSWRTRREPKRWL